jgi:uncharacterized OsmC-like protein
MGRNLLSQEETNIQGNKLPVTGRDLSTREETFCHTERHLKIDIQMDEEEIKITLVLWINT